MKKEIESFSMFWLPVGHDNRYYLVPDDYYDQVPWFIWGKNLEKFKATNTFNLSEECLLKGILYGLSPSCTKVGGIIYDEDVLLAILDKLQEGFKYKSRELLILDAALNVRDINGVHVANAILRTGMNLLPESSKIKSDYIVSLWEIACEKKDNASIYTEIIELIPNVDLEDVLNTAKQVICYYGFCSLLLLKEDTILKQDVDKYRMQYIDGVITHEEIRPKIDILLNNPDKKFTAKELCLDHDS